MTLEDLLRNVQVLAVLCNQYGDSGKGKFSDFFASEWADIIARGTGGANAGHTVVIDDVEHVFHLIPAGILYDAIGKINVLGNGMVIEPESLGTELDTLDAASVSYRNLKISKDAHVTLPFHIEQDRQKNLSQARGGIGTTGRGVGPTYEDKTGRRGVSIGDLYNQAVLVEKIGELLKDHYPKSALSVDEIVRGLREHAERIEPFVCDTVALMHNAYADGKRIALEGAQGLLLSIEHGMKKYCTSSDCSLNGTASGVGLSASAVDRTFGIVKFPFMTRVGGGPFTTEIGGSEAGEYCDGRKLSDDLEELGIPHLVQGNHIRYDRHHPAIIQALCSTNPMLLNIAIRLVANEYGATTGRARRIGWTDAVAARYAVAINGPQVLILTKADAVAGMPQFNICYDYKTKEGASVAFSREPKDAAAVTPQYKTYEGYQAIAGVTDQRALPASLMDAVKDFEHAAGARVGIISTGADQKHNVFL